MSGNGGLKMLKGPRGGLWLELKKLPAADRPVAELKAPGKIFLPLRQFKGFLPTLCVAQGEHVLMGQPVAISAGGVSCSLHSPVSGTIFEITEYDHPLGGHSQMIVIENDGRDITYKKVLPQQNAKIGRAEIIEAVKNSAVVAASGFCPPLWARLAGMSDKKIKTVVINAVEAEPYICSSQKLLDESPDSVAQGLSLIMKCLGASAAVLAVSDDVPPRIVEGMAASARLEGIMLKVAHIAQKYPLGNELYLMRELFPHEVENAPAQFRSAAPEELHVGFFCAEDCFNVSRAIIEGQPQTTRIITVAGDAVEDPQNLEVRIGSTVRDVLDFCGLNFDPDRVVLGSVMRGVAVTKLNTPITKSVTAVLALKAARGGFSKSNCINCGKCVSVCPQGLLPNYIAMRAVKADFDALRELHIKKCIECGSCAYICPGRMPIVELIKNIKKAAL
jgi:electron transport complex protein RnfC